MQFLKCQGGETACVSSFDNTSHSLEGVGFYISDLSVYGKTDQIIAHSSNTFPDNYDWWTESTQKKTINYDSEGVIKEAKMRLGPGETVVTWPPSNARPGVIFCNSKYSRKLVSFPQYPSYTCLQQVLLNLQESQGKHFGRVKKSINHIQSLLTFPTTQVFQQISRHNFGDSTAVTWQ